MALKIIDVSNEFKKKGADCKANCFDYIWYVIVYGCMAF